MPRSFVCPYGANLGHSGPIGARFCHVKIVCFLNSKCMYLLSVAVVHYSSPMGVDELSKSRFCSYTFTIVFDSWLVHIESFFGFFDLFVLTLWGKVGHVEVRINSTMHIKIQTFVDWIDSQIEMNHDTSIYVPVESSTMYCRCNNLLEVWHS